MSSGPSTHQDSPKVPEKAVEAALARLEAIPASDPSDTFLTAVIRPQIEVALEAAMPHMLSALLSDEVVGAIANLRKALREAGEEAKELQVEAAGGEQNSSCVGEPPALDSAHAALDCLQSAIEQVGGGQGGS